MSCEVTQEWEYWQEVSPRSGARVLVRWGRETQVVDDFMDNGENRFLSLKFHPPIQCLGGDQIKTRQTFRAL